MTSFLDLYNQIIRIILKNESDLVKILPKISNENNIHYIPEGIFPPEIDQKIILDEDNFLLEIEAKRKSLSKVLLVIPPLGLLNNKSKEIKEKFPGIRSIEAIVLLDLVGRMKSGDRLIALVSESFLLSKSLRIARDKLFDLANPLIIIKHELLSDGFHSLIHPGFKMQTIVLEKNNDLSKPIKFFKLINPVSQDEQEIVLKDFKILLKQGGGQTKFGYVIPNRSNLKGNWNYELHHPSVNKKIDDLKIYGETILFSDFFEIKLGKINTINSQDLVANLSEKEDGIPVIEGRDLLSDGSINYDTRFRVIFPTKDLFLKAGDILIRSINNSSIKSVFPVIEITESDTQSVCSRSVIILRPKKILSKEERLFFLSYLRSETFLKFLNLENHNLIISISSLGSIPIPLPDADLMVALRDLNEASIRFEKWKHEVELAKQTLFSFTSASDSKLKFLSEGRLARQRVEAGLLVENLSYKIRTQFPHPLAYHWRIVEASNENLEGYSNILETAELALCYLSCMLIVATNLIPDDEINYIKSLSKNLCELNHGTNMGDWISILREKSSLKSFERYTENVSFYEVFRILSNEETNSAVQRLKNQRDNNSHGRGPKKSSSLLSEFTNAKNDLDILFKAMDFLTDYPLIFIESTNWDSISKQMNFTFRDIRGDHPFVPLQESTNDNKDLEAGSLYIIDRNHKFHLIRPLLIRKECPICGSWATFFLDGFDKKNNSPIMKSMEHGHTINEPSLLSAFKHYKIIT